jgi:thiamine-phosphate pyrophosphorylase
MSDELIPQIYLISPPELSLDVFPDQLKSLLDQYDIACVRMALSSTDETVISKTADKLRDVCHNADVSLVIESHYKLVEPLGLDGVHLVDGARSVRDVRAALGADPIVGAHCGTKRHTGMNAGEAGADYICFGPVAASTLGTQEPVEFEVFEAWSQMIEIPVVAEGAISLDMAEKLAPVVDWFALGSELWDAPDGANAALDAFLKRIS